MKKQTWLSAISISGLGIVLSGCMTQPQKHVVAVAPLSGNTHISTKNVSGSEQPLKSLAHLQSEDLVGDKGETLIQRRAEKKAEDGDRVYSGTDAMVKLPQAKHPIKVHGEAVSINFEQAPLEEVVHAVLGEILQLDYIIEHPIAGQVTVRTRTPVKREQLLTILESLLKSNGALMVRGDDELIYVSGSPNITRVNPELSSPNNIGAGYSTTIIPLQYIGAAEMAEILRPMAEESSFVRVDGKRNVIIMAGTRSQMQGWLDIVTTFDIDMLAGMSVGIFPIEYGEVATINNALAELVGAAGASAEGSLAGLPIKVIPLEELNSLLVVTPRKRYLKQVKLWIDRLDQAPESGLERSLHVYPVQNATSEHLAELLSNVYGGAKSGKSTSSTGVAPGLSQESVSKTGTEVSKNKTSSSSASQQSTTSVSLEGGVKVVADEVNNALLIFSTKAEYERIAVALNKLDVVPKQILIEASIVEVSLRDEFQFGLEWTFSGSLGGGNIGKGLLANGKSPLTSSVPGFSYAIADAAGGIKAVLNALASESLVNVISTPSVMALDNHEASIKVGDQQPIRSSQSSSTNGDVLTSSVTYKDTGVQLSVTPSVNAGGLVTMDISQSVTDVGEIDDATGQRAFNTRDVKSRVAVRSGESVVLGGLIRENQTNSDIGLPGLHKIPVLGHLFGKTTELGTRTELLVIITPRVISNDQELMEVGLEMRSAVRALELIQDSVFNKK